MRTRARGNYKAATQQRDSTNVVINKIVPLSISFPVGESLGGVALNIWDQLATSSFYANYAPMYDQLKLTGVRVKINGSIQGTNVNAYLTPTVTTAWDRNGITNNQYAAVISTYSSAISKPWSLGNAFTQTRSVFAQTMSEKSQYLATTALSKPTTDAESPRNPTPASAIPFKPQLLLQVALPIGSALGGQTMSFNCELDMMVKFRGLRKGTQPTNAPPGTLVPPLTITSITHAGATLSTSSFATALVDTPVTAPSPGGIFTINDVEKIITFRSNIAGAQADYTVPAGYRYARTNSSDPQFYISTSDGQDLPTIRWQGGNVASNFPGTSYNLPNTWIIN